MIGYAYWSTLLWHECCCQVSNLHFDCKDLFLQFPDHSPATVSTRGTILLASTMELTVLSRCCCFLDSYPLNPWLSSPCPSPMQEYISISPGWGETHWVVGRQWMGGWGSSQFWNMSQIMKMVKNCLLLRAVLCLAQSGRCLTKTLPRFVFFAWNRIFSSSSSQVAEQLERFKVQVNLILYWNISGIY